MGLQVHTGAIAPCLNFLLAKLTRLLCHLFYACSYCTSQHGLHEGTCMNMLERVGFRYIMAAYTSCGRAVACHGLNKKGLSAGKHRRCLSGRTFPLVGLWQGLPAFQGSVGLSEVCGKSSVLTCRDGKGICYGCMSHETCMRSDRNKLRSCAAQT